jgi:hypothetical protein
MSPLTWSTDVGSRSVAVDVHGEPDATSVDALCARIAAVAGDRTGSVLVRIGPRLGGGQTADMINMVVDQAAAGTPFLVSHNETGHRRRSPTPRSLRASFSALMAASPQQHVVSVDLLPLPGVARYSRKVLKQACSTWDITDLQPEACLVVTELVEDGRRRFPGPSTLTVLRHSDALYVAVRRGPETPVSEPGESPGDALIGLGFVLIHACATCWGVAAEADDVITWAALSLTK